jgi:fatty acid synthase subunit alpha, fungi type/fatty acid synthase subunit beta, fungi type
VAAKHSKIKDEPIKDLLGNINSSLVDKLVERVYGGDTSKIPTIDYLCAEPGKLPLQLAGIEMVEAGDEVTYTLGENLPEVSSWLETLASPKLSWLRALLTSVTIVQGTLYINNPIRRLLAPRRGQRVIVSPTSVIIYGAARSYGPHKDGFKALEVLYTATAGLINVAIYEEHRDVSVPLLLHFQYKPSMSSTPIHEIAEGRNERIKQFYWKLWYGDSEVLPDIRDTFTGPEITVEARAVETFCAVVGNQGERFKTTWNSEVKAPMDFAIVTG